MSDPLSVLDAARETPAAFAIAEGSAELTFSALAERVRERLASLPDLDPRVPVPVAGSVSLDTAVTLFALLERRAPALLLHPRLTEPEREALLASASASPPLDETIAAVAYTSGTTGEPRGALLGRDALVASARASEANLGWHDDDRWLVAMPLAHVGGLSILARCLIARRGIVLWPRFDAARFAEVVDSHRVTLASMVPTMLSRVFDANPRWSPPAHLRAILVGGAGISGKVLAEAKARRVPIVASYGLTETCAQFAATRYGSRFDPAGEHSGFPLPGAEVRIDEGRIEVRGPMMMRGYWNEPPLADGAWFDTGDLGELDSDGALIVHARRVDLVVTGGENVYPAEVERALEALRGIAEAAVFGVADERWGQRVAALLVADGPAPDDGTLRSWIDGRLAPHRRPRLIAFVPELPRTRGGKLDRAALMSFASRLRPL